MQVKERSKLKETMSFNQPTPQQWKCSDMASMQPLATKIASVRARLLESSLHNAIMQHIGYMPEPEQFKARAHCVILPDGTHCYSWDGVEFYRNKITMQF